MEASARVLILILEVLQHFPTIRVTLQPKAADHPDFLFLVLNECDEMPILIIEVEKRAVNTMLAPQDEVTAQVIR